MERHQIATSVIIVGAGPAGAATSIFLSMQGIDHLVLEKDTFPRDKVCGDACSGKTAMVIKKANPLWLDEIHQNSSVFLPSWGIRFVAPNAKGIDIPFKKKETGTGNTPKQYAPGFTVPRLQFDNFLFQKMNSKQCTVMQGAIIRKIIRGSNEVKVHIECNNLTYEITAPLIVGADGDKSIVRKTFIAEEVNEKSYAIGLRGYYKGVTNMHQDNFIELHFLKELLPGYLWIFPLPNGMANVGVGILSKTVRKKKINLRNKMLTALQTNKEISKRFENAELIGKIQGWGLPLAVDRKTVCGDNFLLVGDAAGLVDPFSGEGIGNAMYSGMTAANAIAAALQTINYTGEFFNEHYTKVLFKKIGDELQISNIMLKMSKLYWLFNFVIGKANKSPSLQNTLSCMFTDLNLRNELSKPSFYLKILLNK